jgi:sporulation protein YlmC with PRC-barrel domain
MEINENNKTTYLQELSASDYEIADHQPDINGWEIIDSLGDEVGEVRDLIFDSNAKKVRYIVAELDFEIEEPQDYDPKVVLIPIGVVDLDSDNDEVVLKDFVATQLLSLPSYESGKIISPVEELAVRHAFLGDASLPNANSVVYEDHPEDFYAHGHFDDSRFTRGPADPGTSMNEGVS